MARRAQDIELDPAVVPIGDAPSGSFEDWLAGLERGDEPTVLPVSAAHLVAEGRAEVERGTSFSTLQQASICCWTPRRGARCKRDCR